MPNPYLDASAIVNLVGKGTDVELHLLRRKIWHVVRMNQPMVIFAGIALRKQERLARLAIGSKMGDV